MPEDQATDLIKGEFTIHGGWILTLIRLVDSYGCDIDRMLADCELPGRSSIKSNDRIPFKLNKALWESAIKETGDPYLAFPFANFFSTATFHALGAAMASSTTLYEALARLSRYSNVLGDAGEKKLFETDDSFCLELYLFRDKNNEPYDHYASMEAFFTVIISLCRNSYDANFNPLKVELMRPEPAEPERYESYFKAPIYFAADRQRIYFDKTILNSQIYSSDYELASKIDQLLSDRFTSNSENDLLKLVRQSLISLLPDGNPTESQVANRLNISERTLQRRLNQADSTFREILAATKKEVACYHLIDPRLTISEIAFLLGYSEESNFARAFKKWTAMSPSEYRNQHMEGHKS